MGGVVGAAASRLEAELAEADHDWSGGNHFGHLCDAKVVRRS